MDSVSKVFPTVVNNQISVQAAAEFSGYSLQYLRRLLRCGRLVGLKTGQVWLIDKSAFESYLEKVAKPQTSDLVPINFSDFIFIEFIFELRLKTRRFI
jgi:excisionase family DNA binding protein